MRITAEINKFDKDLRANVGVRIESHSGVEAILRPTMYQAILRAMRDTDKKAFYAAMGDFAEEDLDGLLECLSGEDDNEE